MAQERAPGAPSPVAGPAAQPARPNPSPDPAPSRISADPKPPTGRGVELVLLSFAAVLVTGALFLVQANTQQPVDNTLLFVGLAYLALFTGAHLAVRRFAPYSDPLILPAAALLNGLGLVMIYRIDLGRAARALQAGQPLPDTFALRQIAWTAIALALFVAVLWLVRDHRMLARYGYTAGFVGLILLALPGLLPGAISEVNGAKLWLRLGIFSIQPAEFAKVLLMIFFAAFLVAKRDLFTSAGRTVFGIEFPRPRDLAPLIVAWALSVGVLVLEKDLGTSLLFFGIVLVLIYTATERVSWLVIGLAFFLGGALLAFTLFDHVQGRIQTWLNPFADFDGSGYQLGQALFGLGTGGVGGTGLGAGRPELVPYAWTDFIIASLGEELGLIGLAALLMVYLVLVTRGLRSALAVRDSFGKLLATGLSFALALQVFVVIGGVSGLIPLTGLTMPFLSYGGSSLVANYALIALLLRISNAARAPVTPHRPGPPTTPLADARTVMVDRDAL